MLRPPIAIQKSETENAEIPAVPVSVRPINVMAFKARDGRPGRGFSGRNLLVKMTLPAIPVIGLVAIIAVGCATKKEAPAASSALDVTPVQPTAPTGTAAMNPPPATYTPPAATYSAPPTYSAGAGYTPPSTPAFSEPAVSNSAEPKLETKSAGSSSTSGGSTYTVQKGDTLFKIAKEHYGDGKQYTKIVAANPGLDPSRLKVGQKITLP